MQPQKNNAGIENEVSVLKIQGSVLSLKNTSKNGDDQHISKAENIEKPSFSERWQNHRFWLVKGSYYLLRSVWIIVMFTGGFIAWLISLLFI